MHNKMTGHNDPTSRRRWDPEDQRKRDDEIMRLLASGDFSQRDIAKKMDCTLGTVQNVKRREEKKRQKIAAAMATGDPEQVLTALDDELTVEEVADQPERWPELNPLERYRLRHQRAALALVAEGFCLPPIHDVDHQLCCIARGDDPDWQPYDADGMAHLRPPAAEPYDGATEDW